MLDLTKPEIWKPYFLDGMPTQYEASSRGRIRNTTTDRILTAVPLQGRGYLRVLIYRNGKRVDKQVHRIVWEAFHGPIPDGLTVDHIDEDKSNNSIENLRLLTASENVKQFLRNHPDHGYQKTYEEKDIRRYFELLRQGVYYKKAWLTIFSTSKSSGYSKRLLYGSRWTDLWKTYQPFPISAYFNIGIDSEKEINLLVGCIYNNMDTESMLRLINKDYRTETIDLVYFLRSKYDKNIIEENYNTAYFVKDLDTLLLSGCKTSGLLSFLHVSDSNKVRSVIESRQRALQITSNKYRHLSDDDAKIVMNLVEQGLSNEEVFKKMNIKRTVQVAMFMASHRKRWKEKMNSEKTSSTIESIASNDVKK